MPFKLVGSVMLLRKHVCMVHVNWHKYILASTVLIVLFTFQNCGQFKAVHQADLSSTFGGITSHDLVRRLSNAEINNSLRDILGDTNNQASTSLPADAMVPYDSDVLAHPASAPLIEGLEQMAIAVSTRLLADTARRDSVLGCVGSSQSDRTCMTNLITKLSLLFFRRPQSTEDINSWTNLAMAQASANQSFYAGVDTFLRLAIMHPRFIYRHEGDGNISYLRAERLAFLLWGTTPDAALLNLAAQNQLATPEQVQAKAAAMLNDAKAIRRLQKFHAEWLAYERLGHPANLANSLKAEADAMVQKVLFADKSPWVQIFLTNETYIDGVVADIYGITGISAPTWTGFPNTRKGILSTGAYLSAGAKFGDTSPTQRGRFVRERLLCQIVPPPPPTINADEPPPPTASGPNCKKNRYIAHAAPGTSCFSCHQVMDPVGFGLERFDTTGRIRSFEKLPSGADNTECPIDGQGELTGVGSFNGPVELIDRMVGNGQLQSCMMQQYFHFAFGREYSPNDGPLILMLKNRLVQGATLNDVVTQIVSSEQFLNP